MYYKTASKTFSFSAMTNMNSTPDLFRDITTFIFDIDGVMTDGQVIVLENGLQARSMSTKDGFALQLAVKKGYRLLVLSGAAPSPVVDRLNKLGVIDIHMNVKDKRTMVRQYMATHTLAPAEVLYMGDDIPDLPPMSVVGLPASPADAVMEVKGIAKYISGFRGGAGCVRDVIEKVLKLNGHWDNNTDIPSR
jgi:3-deoxy-D-manno-octulosonate 8-phosphate phosphatase (KDO 8-P phosphatase)